MSVKVDQIVRSERKTIEIQVSIEGHIIVRAPLNETMKEIDQYIESKKFWLLRTQQITKARYLNDLHKKYEDGERFLYLGKERPLKIINNSVNEVPLFYRDGSFCLSSSYLKFANKIFIDWYKDKAKEYVSDVAERYSKLYDIPFDKVSITNAFSQWASCSGNGCLNFSWRVILVPKEVISYLVVHELAHILLRDHSQDYWIKVEQMMPDYLKHENWLKNNDHICSMFKNEIGSYVAKSKGSPNTSSDEKSEQFEFEI